MDYLAIVGVIFTLLLTAVAIFAIRAAYQFKGDVDVFRERMYHYKDLADTRLAHIEIQRDRIIGLNKSLVTLNEQLEVVKAVNLGDNRFATQDPFQETQVMAIDGMITPYQKQK